MTTEPRTTGLLGAITAADEAACETLRAHGLDEPLAAVRHLVISDRGAIVRVSTGAGSVPAELRDALAEELRATADLLQAPPSTLKGRRRG